MEQLLYSVHWSPKNSRTHTTTKK